MEIKIFFCLSLLFCTLRSRGQELKTDSSYLSGIKTELRAIWPNNRTINIVFHGHSGPGGSWGNHEVHTLESYPHLVLKKLKQLYPYAVINIIVTAIGGENAEKGQLRFQSDVLNNKPDIVVIDYSGNDIASGLEKASVAWGKMIQQALDDNCKVILVTPGNDQRMDILQEANAYEQHAEQIRQLAIRYRVALADPFLHFQQIARNGDLKEYMSHINHFNEKGHEMYAEEIMKWFK